MNNLQIFKNEELGEIRTLMINKEPWFVAKDICDILEIKNSRQALTRLDEDEKADVILNDGSQNRNMSTVNEYGLYNLILASRKQEAKNFKRWITHEVIPAIRKTGGYLSGEEHIQSDEELIAKAFNVINKKLEQAQQKLKEQEHKVLFADSVTTSKDCILIGDLAKILKQNGIDIGQKRLFKWLRNNSYLSSRKGDEYNSPTQKSMNLRLFEVKETTAITAWGVKINRVTKVTGRRTVIFYQQISTSIQRKTT